MTSPKKVYVYYLILNSISILFIVFNCIVLLSYAKIVFLHQKIDNLLNAIFVKFHQAALSYKSFSKKRLESNLNRSFYQYSIGIHRNMNKHNFHGYSHIYVDNHDWSFCIHHDLKNEKYDININFLKSIAM